MELEFWIEAWEQGRTAFHQKSYNPTMKDFFKDINLKDKTIFIPMAGKTLDINFFLEKGANVIAIECSSKAIQEFFNENNIECQLDESEKFTLYKTKHLKFYNGDFFKLTKDEVGQIDYIYDRASIVALPQKMRSEYVGQIKNLINERTKLCIITFECDSDLQIGPPFMIPRSEINKSYQNIGIELKHEVIETMPAPMKYQEKGVKELRRVLWTNNNS